nr:type I-C CRISPR-associated protein Cas8c/Csd1 [Enterococcus sp. MJM16]
MYETYEENKDQVGEIFIRNNQKFSLLPIGHIYRKVQIEVTVTQDGEFFSARVLGRDEALTMIPVTEKSANKSNNLAPNILHDELKYVAKDFETYVDTKKKKDEEETANQLYISQLAEYATENRRMNAVYNYLKQGTLIGDLVKNKILFLDENDKLLPKWTKELTEEKGFKPEIFDVISGTQDSAMVRFTVHDTKNSINELPIWEDQSMTDFYIEQIKKGDFKKEIDYVTGETMPVASYHNKGLRYGGDGAKIISANDSTNFTYRGRFVEKDDVATVGYEVSQKAHNALKWLIMKQGITQSGRVYLVWGKALPEKLTPVASSNELLDDDDEEEDFFEVKDRTREAYAKRLRGSIYGRKNELAIDAKVNILILDSAGKGRLGILYYNSTNQKDYLERIEKWHRQSSWRHTYFVNKQRRFSFGAPNLFSIAKAALGERTNEKLIQNTVTLLFTCVVEEKKVPFDITQNLFHRASNPQSFEQHEDWLKTIEIACSMANNYYFKDKGGCSVSLNKESNERNYLFGRLLAVSHILEQEVLNEQKRSTNAERYMNAFSTHPVKTWLIIRKNLQPYISRLSPPSKIRYNKLFDEIMNQFDETTYTDKALDGRYLLGYYSQEYDIFHKSTYEEAE